MPIHQYKCQSVGCEHEYEVFYKTPAAVKKEERAETCPKCTSKKKKRLISTGTSFILKGPNWARDGYG
jgi:putative FmdB family regulatory protein